MDNNGKELCRHLKAVRREIAEQNGIELHQEECTHEGPCMGTCPRCEQEVKFLENKLSERKRLGKAVAIVGIAASTVVSSVAVTSCINTGLPYYAGEAIVEEDTTYHPHDTVPDSGSIAIIDDAEQGND